MISRTQPRTTGSVGRGSSVGASAFDLEERERDGRQDDVMRPALIAAAFEVIEAEVVFELAILLFDRPAAARERDQVDERRRVAADGAGSTSARRSPSARRAASGRRAPSSAGRAAHRTARSAGRRCRCPRSRTPTRPRGPTAAMARRGLRARHARDRDTSPRRESRRHSERPRRSEPGAERRVRCRSRHRPRRR